MRQLAAALLLTLAAPTPAAAQLPLLEGLFKKVTDVNLFGVLGWFTNRPSELAGRLDDGEPRSGGLTGLGFEVSFVVDEFSPRRPPPQDMVEQAAAVPRIDTIQVEKVQPDGARLIYKVAAEEPPDPDNRWMVELALGYTEFQDFVSARPGLDVRGSVREFPSVSLYLNRLPADDGGDPKWLSYYAGVRTGLAHLQGFRGYVGDPSDGVLDAIYSGGGTTFQFGVAAGTVISIGPVDLFVEPGYTRRRFSGVEWAGISGAVSDLLPRSLDMSTFSLSIGTQLQIGAAGARN